MDELTIYRKPRKCDQTSYFVAVAQCDSGGQMSVVRWLLSDVQYRVCGCLHDRDENKNPHIHLLLKTPQKMTANTMIKRFGGYLFFDATHDPYEAARYLTHETFASQNKYRYERSSVFGDMEFYNNMMKDAGEVIQYAAQWSALLDECNGNMQDAFALAVSRNYTGLVKSIMSHGYFYEKYFKVCHTVERCIYDADGEVLRREVTEQI